MPTRWCALLLVAGLLAGCGLPVLQVPIGQAALVYADTKTAYTVLELRITELCKSGKLSAADCTYLDKEAALLHALDADIRQGILDATAEIDWTKVMRVLQILAGMAVKVGGL